MKILVATSDTQGRRKNDFCFAKDGDIVYAGWICDRDVREGPDGGCGCGRALFGVASLKGTTTVTVAEVDIDRIRVIDVVADAFVRAELFDSKQSAVDSPDIKNSVDLLLAEAEKHRVGTVLEFRARVFSVRSVNSDRV